METLILKPRRGGCVKPLGCGLFIREFLGGHSLYGSPAIDPAVGASQADIYRAYKEAMRQACAMRVATAEETRSAKSTNRPVDLDNISRLQAGYIARTPRKAYGCSLRSFVAYLSDLVRLGWVQQTGRAGEPVLYRLTQKGIAASEERWANPLFVLYPEIGHSHKLKPNLAVSLIRFQHFFVHPTVLLCYLGCR